MINSQYGFGYIPDLPDHRDRVFAASPKLPPTLPAKIDLRPQTYPKPCYDQSSANSCTGNSVAAMHGFIDRKQGGSNINPSRRQIYYDARANDGLQNVDAGAAIRSALYMIGLRGVAPEELFTYDVSKINEQPGEAVYIAAEKKKALVYLRLDINVDVMRACLAEGFPFVIGSTLYQNYYDASSTGMVPMPSGSMIGGHAQMYVGYDDSVRRFIVQGSWGTWGDRGFTYWPYDYAANENYSADAWTLRSEMEVTEPPPPPNPTPTPFTITGFAEKANANIIRITPDSDASGLKGKRVTIQEIVK